MITEEKARVLDVYDLAKEIVLSEVSLWRQNIWMIQKVNPEKLKKLMGFLSLEGGPRGIRIYAMETSCIPKHFLRNAAEDRDPEIRKRARELLRGEKKPEFKV